MKAGCRLSREAIGTPVQSSPLRSSAFAGQRGREPLPNASSKFPCVCPDRRSRTLILQDEDGPVRKVRIKRFRTDPCAVTNV